MAYDIGPRIGIEGEKEFRDAVRDINAKVKSLGAEMQAVASKFDKSFSENDSVTSILATPVWNPSLPRAGF